MKRNKKQANQKQTQKKHDNKNNKKSNYYFWFMTLNQKLLTKGSRA